MSWLTLPITIPLTIFAVLFAVSNLNAVTVGIWPLEQTWDNPVYKLALGMLGGGFLLGALYVWLLSHRTAYRLWQQKREVKKLSRELDAARTAPPAPAGTASAVLPPADTPLLASKVKS